jgi:hypothetical protein
MRRGRMTEHIPQKLNNLFKNDVLFRQFLLEKSLKDQLVIKQFFEGTEKSSKRANLN